MACGLPAIAVDAYGPAEIVDAGETGWLVAPDDEGAMADGPRRGGQRRRRAPPPRRARLRGRPRPLLVAGAGARSGDGLRRGRRPAPAVRGHAYADAPLTAIPYRIRRSERARHARILVDGDGVEVVVPRRFPLREVEPFVEEKRAWIERTLRRMREARERAAAAAARATAARCPTWASGSSCAVRVERRRQREHVARARRRAARWRSPPGRDGARRARALVPAPRARRGGAAPRRRLRALGRSYTTLQIRGQRTRWASLLVDRRDELQLAAAAGAPADPRLRGRARGRPPRGAGPLAALLDRAGGAGARTGASTSAGCARHGHALRL